ncbi:uncharacterized protein LOC125877188 [Solanum stenotomum]|uniref:uncharacterized protein LOC125877188 n=1 Tax=Solanum stenotomum TaxID=172797 RepID=UPI0020D1ABFA|nr:uncharacterized protein LOC125877188 [Solanum stenotomum]
MGHNHHLTSQLISEDSNINANSEKELGNECCKQKKFNEAIDCYSRSIALSPTAVSYGNRAITYLKIKRFEEAENDCTEALNLDDRYIKAYSRCSTTMKELGKLKESIEGIVNLEISTDAQFALRLEPQNPQTKKQYGEVKALYEKILLVTKRENQNRSKLQLLVRRQLLCYYISADIANVKAKIYHGPNRLNGAFGYKCERLALFWKLYLP